ncbi:MAG: hypothetical protein V3T65_00110 [Acidobacteriota bacterium]
MMSHEEMLEYARRSYSQPAGKAVRVPFPQKPKEVLPPGEFLDRLIDAAFRNSPNLLHPFASRLANGNWEKPQLQEWVRQEYQRIVLIIRRHALIAGNSTDHETIWGLLARVKAEADVDPVGGNFFALPTLWIKFGIALGVSREEIAGYQPHTLLGLLYEALLTEVRFSSALPVREVVDACISPVFYRLWGEALERSCQLPHDALDYFWARAADHWGQDTGRSILLRGAESAEVQEVLWREYQQQMKMDREWHRLTILQRLMESGTA